MKLPPKLAGLYSQIQEGHDRDDPEQAALARELGEVAEVLEVIAGDKGVTIAIRNSALGRHGLPRAKQNSLLQHGARNPVVPLRIGPRPTKCTLCGRPL